MKVFGIGLSKTGTTSLAHALEILGYRTKDYPGVAQYLPGDLATLDAGVLESHDALTDTPIPSLYKQLDARFPGAKFILTVRDMDGWLKSCKRQFTQKHADNLNEAHHRLFMDLYGCTVFDEDRFRQGYERFLREVQAHFRDRPQDLLVLNVSAGEGWDKLCPFLARPQPEIPFPKANVTQIRWMNIQDVVSIAREAGALLGHTPPGPRSGGPGPLAKASLMLARGWGAARGGRQGALQAARMPLEKLISKRLQALNAQIPVISSTSPTVPPAERARLNHYWLVDPLDGVAPGAGPTAEYSVNIALIEDMKPIYGVVYAPASDTVYYAAQGKGAFKAQGDAPATRLAMYTSGGAQPDAAPAPQPGETAPASKALGLCRVAEGAPASGLLLRDVLEWQTAAGDAVLRSVGLRLRHCQTRDELKYDQPDLHHDCLVIG